MITFYKKLKDFKENLLNKNKELAMSIVLKKRSSISNKMALFNILNMICCIIIIKNTGFWLSILCGIIFLLSFSYIVAYINSNKTRKSILEIIDSKILLESISEQMKELLYGGNYLYTGLLFDDFDDNYFLENREDYTKKLVKQLSYLSIEDAKELNSKLTTDESNIFINALTNSYDNESFKINVIDELLEKYEEIIQKEGQQSELMDALSQIKGSKIECKEESLLDLMTKECFLNKEPENLNIVIKKML